MGISHLPIFPSSHRLTCSSSQPRSLSLVALLSLSLSRSLSHSQLVEDTSSSLQSHTSVNIITYFDNSPKTFSRIECIIVICLLLLYSSHAQASTNAGTNNYTNQRTQPNPSLKLVSIARCATDRIILFDWLADKT